MENMANLGYFGTQNAESIFKGIPRIRRENLCVRGEEAKKILVYSPNMPRDIKVCTYISVNDNMNFKFS